MSATHSPSDPGSDLKEAWAGSWLPWLKGRTASLRARLSAPDPVLLLRPDGSQSVCVGGVVSGKPAATKKPRFVAVEIPDELLLRRSLVLPKMSAADTEEALLLDVRSNSPFAAEDLAWGCTLHDVRGGQRRTDIAIASRRHIADFIQAKWPDLARGEQPEVWAVAGFPAPVVIGGYGEQRRLLHAQSRQRWDLVMLFAACALAALAAMTPTAQLRLRSLEAAEAFQALVGRAAPLVRKRDELVQLNERLRSLDTAVADRIDPAQVLEYLTQVLPDDTHLYALEIRNGKITASGHTVDASALLQKLSSDPKLREVRSPTAVTRVPGAAKEAFTVEFTMDMKQAAVAGSPVAAAAGGVADPVAPAVPASASASGPAASSALDALAAPAAPAAAVPAKVTSKPAASSPFVIGGAAR